MKNKHAMPAKCGRRQGRVILGLSQSPQGTWRAGSSWVTEIESQVKPIPIVGTKTILSVKRLGGTHWLGTGSNSMCTILMSMG